MTIDDCRQQLQIASALHLEAGPPSSEERHLVKIWPEIGPGSHQNAPPSITWSERIKSESTVIANLEE